MNKIIDLSALSRFWTKVKAYIDNALLGKAEATHTHSEYATSTHGHSYNDLSNRPTIPTTVAELTDASNYALKSEVTTYEIATNAEIDALFA